MKLTRTSSVLTGAAEFNEGVEVSNQPNPHNDAEFEEANSRLTEGLESCRTLMRNYRAVLGSDAGADEQEESTELK